MKTNNTIFFSLLIGLSLFFKILFFSFLTASQRPLISGSPSFYPVALKIGKKRRRPIYTITFTEDRIVDEECMFANKPETENSNELLKRLKLPLLCFFTGCISFIDAQISSFLYPPSSLSIRKHLSLSILRI